jgi:hypothetical protein
MKPSHILKVLYASDIPSNIVTYDEAQTAVRIAKSEETAWRYGDYGERLHISETLQRILDEYGLYLDDAGTYGEGFHVYSNHSTVSILHA